MRPVKEVRKDHASTALGKVVSEAISAQVALTTFPSLSVSEAVPPGLPVSQFNSADSETRQFWLRS